MTDVLWITDTTGATAQVFARKHRTTFLFNLTVQFVWQGRMTRANTRLRPSMRTVKDGKEGKQKTFA